MVLRPYISMVRLKPASLGVNLSNAKKSKQIRDMDLHCYCDRAIAARVFASLSLPILLILGLAATIANPGWAQTTSWMAELRGYDQRAATIGYRLAVAAKPFCTNSAKAASSNSCGRASLRRERRCGKSGSTGELVSGDKGMRRF